VAFEEAGKCRLCIIGLMMPDQLMAEFPFYDLVGSHLSKLPAAGQATRSVRGLR